MDLLIDTHVFLWWDEGGKRLPGHVFAALSDPGVRIYVSAATVWEIAIKRRAGKLILKRPVADAVLTSGFMSLPMTAAHAEIAGGLDWDHRDPFDRILLAQCVVEKLALVTADAKMRARSEIAQFWAR